MKGQISARIKARIYRRDGLTCRYCKRPVRRRATLCERGSHYRPDDATIDHVVPKSQGGKTNMGNCIVACHRCNQAKGSMHPLDFQTMLKDLENHPDKDRIKA